MSKILKKSLSLFLALVLTLTLGAFAFAAEPETDIDSSIITAEEAKEIALEYLSYKNQTSIVYEDEYEYEPAYKVISTVVLNNNKVITFVCYVSKDGGDVLYRTGSYIGLDINALDPLSQNEALNYAIAAFGANKDDVVVLKSEKFLNDDGGISYHFVFCEGVFESHECTVDANTGFIDDIKIIKPLNLVDRIVLMIRVLIARFNLSSFIKR